MIATLSKRRSNTWIKSSSCAHTEISTGSSPRASAIHDFTSCPTASMVVPARCPSRTKRHGVEVWVLSGRYMASGFLSVQFGWTEVFLLVLAWYLLLDTGKIAASWMSGMLRGFFRYGLDGSHIQGQKSSKSLQTS